MSSTPTSDRAARKESFGRDIIDPVERKRSHQYMRWVDHGILRTFWTNFGTVAEDVYRSNQPDHARLERAKDMGVKAILNLRGKGEYAPYLFEEESCAALGLELFNVPLKARKPSKRKSLLSLFETFDVIPRPFLMHCKSGADRAGLGAALYRLDQGEPIAEARKELSLRFIHLKFSQTGVQDHLLDLFEQRQADRPISIRDWITHEYDPEVLAASFAKQPKLPI